MLKQRPQIWLLPILIISLMLNALLIFRNSNSNSLVKVIGVIDGDTLVLEGKSKVRLRHIDAPELMYCGGKESKKNLEKLVLNQKVQLSEQIPDQYGRSMALIYQGKDLINQKILASGWAIYHSDTTSQKEMLKSAATLAKSRNLGIYGLCQSKDIPDKKSCVIKGNIDKSTDSHKYYLPGCAQYGFTVVEKNIGENWFCTELEAQKAGFSKAETCN